MKPFERFLIYLLISILNGLVFGLLAWAIAGPGYGLAVFLIVAAATMVMICWCSNT